MAYAMVYEGSLCFIAHYPLPTPPPLPPLLSHKSRDDISGEGVWGKLWQEFYTYPFITSLLWSALWLMSWYCRQLLTVLHVTFAMVLASLLISSLISTVYFLCTDLPSDIDEKVGRLYDPEVSLFFVNSMCSQLYSTWWDVSSQLCDLEGHFREPKGYLL